MPTYRKRVLLPVLAAIACSLELSTAQRYVDDPGGPYDLCTYTYAVASFPNVDGVGDMSAACSGGTSGDVSHSFSANNDWQCVQEVSRTLGQPPVSYKMLEHLWRFSNVPPGRQWLQFEAHKAPGPLDEGAPDTQPADDFIFLMLRVSPGVPCPMDVSGATRYNLVSSNSNYATFIHSTQDAGGAVSLGTVSTTDDVCVLLQSVQTCPDDPSCQFLQVDAGDHQRDQAYIDRLAICRQP